MKISDERMLKFREMLLARGTIRFKTTFSTAIGLRKQNARSIEIGDSSFTIEQCIMACELYNGNMNYIAGFENEPFRNK